MTPADAYPAGFREYRGYDDNLEGYISNLPPGVRPVSIDILTDFEETEWSSGSVAYAETDVLEAGSYELADIRSKHHTDQSFRLDILPTPYGKAVGLRTAEPAGVPYASYPNAEHYRCSALAQRLGFIVVDQINETGAFCVPPTPRSLVHAARDFGVEVQLMTSGKIPGGDYLQAFANGTYPVALGIEDDFPVGTWYHHDVSDDHLPAIALGGTVLRDILAAPAREALRTQQDIAETAKAIDSLTARLTYTLFSYHWQGPIIPRDIREIAAATRSAAIEADTVRTLLGAMIGRAAELELPVNPLADG